MTFPAYDTSYGGTFRDHLDYWRDPSPFALKSANRPATRMLGAILAGSHPACIEVGNALGLNPAEWLSISTDDFKAPRGCGFGRVLVDAASVGDVSREIQDALNVCARPHRMQWHWIDRDVL